MSVCFAAVPKVVSVLAIVLPSVVVFGFLMVLLIRTLRKKAREQVALTLAGVEIILRDDFANCIGIKGKGIGRRRGNGILVLTSTELDFFPFVGKQESVPFSCITKLQIKKTHCGKSIFRDLLGVDYEIDGETVSAAWFTRNLNEFQLELEKLTGLKFDGGVSSS